MLGELATILSEQERRIASHRDIVRGRKLWESGELNSQAYFGELVHALFTSDHVISNLSSKVSEIRRWYLVEAIQNSPALVDSYQLGIEGKNPPVSEVLSAYSALPNFHLIKKRNRLAWGGELEAVHVPNLELIDSQLPVSLIAHALYADWMPNLYPQGKEGLGENHYYNAVVEAITDSLEAMTVYKWIKSENLLMSANKRSVQMLLGLVPDKKRPRRFFEDLESFFAKMSPAIYFSGWAMRLVGIVSRTKATLPDYLTSEFERKLVTAAYFLRMKEHRVIAFREVVAAISQHNIEVAKQCLAQAQIQSPGERALTQWQIRELGLESTIAQERDSLVELHKANRVAGAAKAAEKTRDRLANKHTFTEEIINGTQEWLVEQLHDFYTINANESVVQISLKPSVRNKAVEEGERLVHVFKKGQFDVSDLKSEVKVRFSLLYSPSGRPENWHFAAEDADKIFRDAFENAESANWEVEAVREISTPDN